MHKFICKLLSVLPLSYHIQQYLKYRHFYTNYYNLYYHLYSLDPLGSIVILLT
jgi:hypothetical protein